jgi:hypothetical protein
MVHITSLVQTLSGCGLIAMHDGKISVLKVYNVRDVNLTMAALHVCGRSLINWVYFLQVGV